MKNTAIIFLIAFSLTSCSGVLTRVVLGVKKEKVERIATIEKYGKRIGLNTESNFYLADSIFSRMNSKFFPVTFIYNDSGKVVEYLDCFGTTIKDLELFFSKYSNENAPVQPDSMGHYKGTGDLKDIESYYFLVPPTFETIKKSVFDSNSTNSFEIEGSKYYIVHFWIKPLHRANKKIYSKVEKIIDDRPEYNTKFIKINMDYLEENGYPKDYIKKKKN